MAISIAASPSPAWTYQEANFGRVYAAYGGWFVVLSILCGWAIDHVTPDFYDIVGGLISLLGVAVIMYTPRTIAPLRLSLSLLIPLCTPATAFTECSFLEMCIGSPPFVREPIERVFVVEPANTYEAFHWLSMRP